jgi:hypothetical protein
VDAAEIKNQILSFISRDFGGAPLLIYFLIDISVNAFAKGCVHSSESVHRSHNDSNMADSESDSEECTQTFAKRLYTYIY